MLLPYLVSSTAVFGFLMLIAHTLLWIWRTISWASLLLILAMTRIVTILQSDRLPINLDTVGSLHYVLVHKQGASETKVDEPLVRLTLVSEAVATFIVLVLQIQNELSVWRYRPEPGEPESAGLFMGSSPIRGHIRGLLAQLKVAAGQDIVPWICFGSAMALALHLLANLLLLRRLKATAPKRAVTTKRGQRRRLIETEDDDDL